MPSYKVFGIYVDKTQSKALSVNNDKLQERVDYLLSNKVIHKVVIRKEWI